MTYPILPFTFIKLKKTSHVSADTELRRSPAPHTQTSFSPGSPAVCTHIPVTPPESAASRFPPGGLPVEVENTHRDDYRGTHGSKEETL